jgi:hypothetical protein
LAFLDLTPDTMVGTTWWSKHDILKMGTGMLSEPKNILIRITFSEKKVGNIYFDTRHHLVE